MSSMSDSDRVDFLEKKISRLKWTNEDLRSKLFEADQRATRLAQGFGFKDVQHAQDAIRPPSCSNVPGSSGGQIQISKEVFQTNPHTQHEIQRTQRATTQLREEPPKSGGGRTPFYRQLNEKEGNRSASPCASPDRGLKRKRHVSALLDKENSPPVQCSSACTHNSDLLPPARHSDVDTSAPQVALLQAQLVSLQECYDHLKEVKAKAARRYSDDYRKWKEFKEWLANSDRGKGISRRRLKEMRRKDKFRQRVADDQRLFTVHDPSGAWGDQGQDDSEIEGGSQYHAGSVQKEKRPLDDYMGFKGRGRYRKDLDDDSQTINAKFEIDPNRNDGLNFRYDAVVRNKEERKRLHAGDCECCRDYYEAVGPPPPRLQQPLWRTPPSSPTTSTFYHANSFTSAQAHEITIHKKAISKHRHNWAMPTTPPQYWSIGFPTTQEVLDINQRAEEMNLIKRRAVEMESNTEGGRYKKR